MGSYTQGRGPIKAIIENCVFCDIWMFQIAIISPKLHNNYVIMNFYKGEGSLPPPPTTPTYIYLYPTRASIYVLIFVFIIAPPDSSPPDLKYLLLEILFLSTDFLLSKYQENIVIVILSYQILRLILSSIFQKKKIKFCHDRESNPKLWIHSSKLYR